MDLSKKTYRIIDNGGTPFLVDVYKNNQSVQIWKASDNALEDDYIKVKTITYDKIYIGNDPKDFTDELGEVWDKSFKGNSILLRVANNKYIFIGWDIYSFKLEDGDTFKHYYSPMGHSSVPYPVLIGKKNSYFMIEKQYASNDLFDLSNELYGQFYDLTNDNKHKISHVKMIQERLY